MTEEALSTLHQEVSQLRTDLDQTRAWCKSLEEQVLELRALFRLLSAWPGG